MKASEEYEQLISANRQADKVDPAVASLAAGNSKLSLRLRGGFITLCQVTDPKTGSPIDILFSEADHSVPKLMATHSMSPAGPFEGPGGQHGFPRWADYKAGQIGERDLTLETTRSDGEAMLTKRFELNDHSLISQTTIYNPDEEVLRTSLGEHYYYPLPGDSTENLTINGQGIDALLGEGTLSQIMSGEAAFWEDWNGRADIRFPAGYRMRLEASVTPDTNLGMLLWHKPGSGTICFEPTAGYKHGRMNTCLCLERGESATLTSSLTLL